MYAQKVKGNINNKPKLETLKRCQIVLNQMGSTGVGSEDNAHPGDLK